MIPTLVRLEFNKVVRNRRFLIFTIVIPTLFYVGLKISMGRINGFSTDYLFYICVMYGMLGNNIVTMSTRIAKEKNFFFNLYKTTTFNIVQNTVVQFMTQAILNMIVSCLLAIVGTLFLNLTLNLHLLLNWFLVYLFCNVFVFIGVLCGYVFDSVSLQTITNPLYMVIVLLSMPGGLVAMLPDFVRDTYNVFPGHLLWLLVEQVGESEFSFVTFSELIGYLVAICVVASVFLVLRQKQAMSRT
ncbi:hypothetical protein EQG49_11990 [Periweissella cryptocerci]|uniref:Uncharacterized protein n=1 Tax=Periweissella cryptocerci TaxID=2506420 RepID=A0A4P6YWA9_9LACO|nr:hypothetical protein [Periweissella cryptocerci]QBO37124.1 hypothetical protein EQG49_11990 [Periweissella cryptocerci]